MRQSRVAIATVFGAFAVLVLTAGPSTQGRRNGRDVEMMDGKAVVAREVIVRFLQPSNSARDVQIERDVNADEIEVIGRGGARRIRSRSMRVDSLLALFSARTDVLYVEPNYLLQIFDQPNDPDFSLLWGLENIGQAVNGLPGIPGADIDARAAWDESVGSPTNVVGVIDTGVDYTHPDLAPNMWSSPRAFSVDVGGTLVTCAAGTHGFNVLAMNCDPMDDHSHGTHVAGTIGAVGNNGIGVSGVNWNARMLAIKFLDETGGGSVADAIKAIQFAVAVREEFALTGNAADVRVLSASWGGPEFSQALGDEIAMAGDHEMLFVAAAGNSASNNDLLPQYPANFDSPNVISVASTTNADRRSWFSNYGATSVDLGAPGSDIYSTLPGGGYGYSSGTSMATPHVSGVAALVLARCVVSTTELKDILVGSVEPAADLVGLTVTGGRLNANSALHACLAPPSAPSTLVARGEDGLVELVWSSGLGATGYDVKRSLSPGGPYTELATGVQAVVYSDTAVVNGTTYYYVVSATNSLGESGDSNEASATPSAPSDLVVSALSVPFTASAGDSIDVTSTIRNNGSNDAPASVTRFYLSTNTLISADDVELPGAQSVPALGPGAQYVSTIATTLPSNLTAGYYFVIAEADADGQVNEVYDTNNTRADSVRIGPDLRLTAMTVPSSVAPGQQIVVADTARNDGGGDATAFVVRFYLSNDTSLSADDLLLTGSRSIPSLAGGASTSGTTTVMIPSTAPDGTLYIIGKADADDEVDELQETNNTRSRPVQIGADLVVSTVTSVSAVGAGETVAVSDTVANVGSNQADASIVRFYLSENVILDLGDDILLTGSRNVGILAAGQTNSGSTMVTLPAGLATGAYYIIAKADADDQVAETRESNNTRARVVSVGPDLRGSVSVSPRRVARGATLVATDTVTNTGGGAAGASTTRFYLSVDYRLGAGDLLLGASRAVPAIAAGGSNSGPTTILIPASVATGRYYLLAVIDADDEVDERYEINNVAIRSVTVTN